MKDTPPKKKELLSLLSFLQQLEIRHRDLFQQFLRLRKCTQALPNLSPKFPGDGNLSHAAVPETDGQNPDRPVALSLAFLTILTTGLIAAHHTAQQGTRQDGGKIRYLPNEALAGAG